MPAVLIEVRRRYTSQEEAGLMAAVHGALVAAFRIPQEDRNIRLVVHEPNRFSCSPDLSHPEYRTIVTVDCFAGRSADAKRRLYTGIVDGLEVFGIPRDHVSTILHEIERENWGVGGGHAASDVDLGFTIEVVGTGTTCPPSPHQSGLSTREMSSSWRCRCRERCPSELEPGGPGPRRAGTRTGAGRTHHRDPLRVG